MGRKSKEKIWESAYLNNATYDDWFNRLRSIGINRIKLEGLPDTVDERFVERGLWERGAMLFFKDPVVGYLCLPFTAHGPLNFYDIPKNRKPYTTQGGYYHPCTDKDSVIIYNNYSHLPDLPTIELFALRIADIQRTIDVNIKGQKTPKIITGNETQRLVMKNLIMDTEGNVPYIFGDKDLNSEIEVKALDTSAPYVADKLEVQKHMMLNEALTYYGIENSNQDKKERLVADEVSSNYGMVENSRNVAVNSRQQGFDMVNKMFGLDIKVRFNSDVMSTVNDPNLSYGGDNVG